jgi:hypothetical protein
LLPTHRKKRDGWATQFDGTGNTLVEICLVLLRKVRLFRRQIVGGEDGVLGAEFGAVSAIDALIGIDKNLGDGSSGRIVCRWRNGSGGALRYAYKILGTGIGNYVSHDERLLDCCRDECRTSFGRSICDAPLGFRLQRISAKTR